MPYSHHSHSGQFCKHATGTLEEVVQEAIHQGFEVYGLTEHVPRYRREDLYPEEFDAFVAEARRVQAAYTSQIQLLVGLETDLITERDLVGLSDILERHGDGIDYLVGSVHHVHGIPIDFDRETFQRCLASIPNSADMSDEDRTGVFLEMYFDAQYEVMQRFKPEIVGHIDLCRLYTPTLDLRAYAAAWSKLTRNVELPRHTARCSK
ncbi:hypothetical protein EWM64_g1911 [Hericium alpestre]|uniref:Histidinol-phosphatase n=1 Tax=Hericium alpestre TaxID=135208 RepID=A0A4Z0A6J3_9AGAM|nr:hypothetical protein EWM64_g1911 [Hericium alpestre]